MTGIECYSVLWAIETLRPNVEELKLKIRTDHDALRWVMTLTDSTGRLTRRRLRISEFDFTITCRPGCVYRVPDPLSRLISPNGSEDNALVTTRHRSANAPETVRTTTKAVQRQAAKRRRNPTRSMGRANDEADEERLLNGFKRSSMKANVENGDGALEDVFDEDIDIFGLVLAYTDAGRGVRIADVPVKLTRNEILDAQRHSDFCQTVLTGQSRKTDSAFYEDEYGLLRRLHATINDIDQIVLPGTLRPRVLDLSQYSKLAGHRGQTRMYHHVRSTYYWPQMAADICRTVRTCNACAKNCVKIRESTHPLRLFPSQRPLESLSIDILEPLTKPKKVHRFLLVTTHCITKLTHTIPLRRIDLHGSRRIR